MANFDEESMRTEIFDIMDELKASLALEKPGSDAHVNIVKELKDMASIIHKDYEVANEIEKDRVSQELKEREFKHDVLASEREMNLKEDQAKRNSRWYNDPIVQTIITTSAAVGLSGMVVYMNCLSENPLKSGASPILMKTLGWVKK